MMGMIDRLSWFSMPAIYRNVILTSTGLLWNNYFSKLLFTANASKLIEKHLFSNQENIGIFFSKQEK